MNTTNYRVEEEEEVEEEVVTTSQQPDYEQRDYGSAGSGRDDYKSDREDDEWVKTLTSRRSQPDQIII